MIHIPEPCGEDFNKMTPTKRGAFCATCKVDTFDFRNLSNPEINQILLSHKGKHICGRFKSEQLDSLNADYLAWKNQQTKTFKSKFLLALLVVFGLTLFSCNSEEAKGVIALQQIEMVNEIEPKTTYINNETEPRHLNLVDLVEVPEPEVCEKKGEVAIEELIELPGEVLGGEPEFYQGEIAGDIDVGYEEYLIDTVGINPVEPLVTPETGTILSARAYPNPVINDFTLEIELERESRSTIAVFDMSGAQVEVVYDGFLPEGERRFQLSTDGWSSGMYLIRINTDNEMETVKVKKME